mmetsp:Transcript_97859/g.204040  ORF Transcript_97859/g.204040 Transcript_97859/m.204040 type:complete len:613 (-) Transcript_97859:29-1867(-)
MLPNSANSALRRALPGALRSPSATWQQLQPQPLQRAPSLPGRLAPAATSRLGCLQQVRHGPKDGRPGRLQHQLFGADEAKGRFYYRFHKIIGRWNWRKYIERYVAPRALENRQRWIPTVFPVHHQMRQSYSWHWRLPKAIAAATTPDEVLEAWVKFRHKHPKKTFHYFKVLKRLIDVGGCDATDWRLRLITSRFFNIHRKTLNLPRLAKYYSQLRVMNGLDDLSRYLLKSLPRYSPQQLALVARAYGSAGLQDKQLFVQVANLITEELSVLTPTDLVHLAEAYASAEVCHYGLLGAISAQLQVRVQQAAQDEAPSWSCPTFEQLTLVSAAFARLKFQDFSYTEMCALQAEMMLAQGLSGPTPPALARLCTSCAKLKIHEIRLYEAVVAHVSQHWYDYPAASLAEIGVAVSPTLPRSEQLNEAYRVMFDAIAADCENLTLKGVSDAAKFMAELDHKETFYPDIHKSLASRIIALRDETKEQYDVARVIEIFARRFPENIMLFSTLSRHIHRHLAHFEPMDFARATRGLAKAKYRDDRVVHALAKWAGKRASEFSSYDWANFTEAARVLRGKNTQLLDERFEAVAPPMPSDPRLGPSEYRLVESEKPTTTAASA